jgi:hypothetical protein
VYYHLHREQLERFVPQFFQAHCGGPGETSG